MQLNFFFKFSVTWQKKIPKNQIQETTPLFQNKEHIFCMLYSRHSCYKRRKYLFPTSRLFAEGIIYPYYYVTRDICIRILPESKGLRAKRNGSPEGTLKASFDHVNVLSSLFSPKKRSYLLFLTY